MATFRITGPDGATYKIEAPDDANESDVLSYAQQHFGQSKQPQKPLFDQYRDGSKPVALEHQGFTREQVDEFERRKADLDFNGGAGWSGVQKARGLTMFAENDLGSILRATVDPLVGNYPDQSWNERRKLHREVGTRLNQMADEKTGTGGTIDKVLGGLAIAPAAGVAAAAGQAGPVAAGMFNGIKAFLPEFLKASPKIAATGAAYGGAASAFDSAGDDLASRASAVPEGAKDGAVGALLFGGGLGAALAAKQGRNAAKAARANDADARAVALEEQGITPFGPLVTDSTRQREAAQSLADSVFGGKLRDAAARTIDDTTTRARKLITQETQGAPSNDLGADMQRTLRRNLTEYSQPHEQIAGASKADLERITGDFSEAGFRPRRPEVQPVKPRQIEPVQPDYAAYPAAAEASDAMVTPKLPKWADFGDDPNLAAGYWKTFQMHKEYRNYFKKSLEPQYKTALDDLIKAQNDYYSSGQRIGNVNGYAQILRSKPNEWTPFLHEQLPPDIKAKHDVLLQKFRDIEKPYRAYADEIETLGKAMTQTVNAITAKTKSQFDTAVSAEVERARLETVSLRKEQREASARQKAEAAAAGETERLRQQALSEASAATRARQQAAEAEWQAQPSTFKPGSSRETYPTEFSAAYTLADRVTPNLKVNLLGKADTYPNQGKGFETNTSRLLTDFERTARTKMEVPHDADTVFGSGWDVTPEFTRFLERNLGRNISQKIVTLVGARNPQAPNAHDIKTITALLREVGTEIGALKRAQRMGEARTEDHAMMARLYEAIKTDRDTFLRSSGGRGVQAANVQADLSRAYKSHADELKRPLAKIFGDQVEPLQAMNRLTAAATDGDLRTLRAFMRLMNEKSDPNKAAAAIIAHLTDNAKDLNSIRKGLASLPNESRDVLFAGEYGKRYRRDLEAVEKLTADLAPFQRAIDRGGLRLGGANSILGAGVVANAIHVMAAPGTVIAGAAAGNLAARFLASPRYVNWLRHTPSYTKSGLQSREFMTHLGRLAAIASHDTETAKPILNAVLSAVSVSKAHATFAGEKAATADKAVLSVAKAMEKAGADRDAIWGATGWFKERDGKWRFEIDDSGAGGTGLLEPTAKASRDSGTRREGQISEFFDHDALYQAYPDIASSAAIVGKTPTDVAGYVPDKNTMVLSNAESGHGKANDGIMLHEMQHLVQAREGFDYGRRRGWPGPGDEYARRPGEVEAWNTVNRHGMSAEERRATPPWKTQNVSPDQVEWSNGVKVAGAAPAAKSGNIFTSLEAAPSPQEVAASVKRGVNVFDIDLNRPESAESVKAIKAAGGKVTAYHVGGGGGRAWKGISDNEQVNKFDTPEALSRLTDDVRGLVAKGADSIHFDNTHRMSGKRLEQIADAIKAGGAGFVAKNNADKWNLVMRRRPDLKPDYAVIEAAMHDADETQAAYDLHARGVPVYIIGFKKTLAGQDAAVTPDYAKDYQRKNPWAQVILMESEEAYDQRTQHPLE